MIKPLWGVASLSVNKNLIGYLCDRLNIINILNMFRYIVIKMVFPYFISIVILDMKLKSLFDYAQAQIKELQA